MEFISAMEFLKQREEVQVVFLDWFNENLSYYDLVQSGIEKMLYRDYLRRIEINSDSYPLFTEGQLRKFIEDKKGLLDIEVQGNGKMFLYQYSINCFKSSDEGLFCGDSTHFEIESDNPLQAYWKVACEIAKESVENEY